MTDFFESFVKRHDFLVCVDSDGCAMDTMNVKHIVCFGPCMVEEWNLGMWRTPILQRWNDVNLYTMTRGVNRFKALALCLAEIDAQYIPIAALQTLTDWVSTAKELSNPALERAAQETGSVCLQKALSWSRAVNAAIAALPESEKLPFDGVAEGLCAAHTFADVAIVSSANRDAVLKEWETHGLLAHVDLVLAQDAGSKAHCIAALLKNGYDPRRVLMVGDAPGDCDAAEQNAVFYYPILVRDEAESWRELAEAALPLLQSGGYAPYGAEKTKIFLQNLGATE